MADYALEHDIKPEGAKEQNGHKVAVIGSDRPDSPAQAIWQRWDMM